MEIPKSKDNADTNRHAWGSVNSESITETFTQSAASISVDADDPIVPHTCIEPELHRMVPDGLLYNEKDEAILMLWKYPKQWSLHAFNFTLKKNTSCDSHTILKHCTSVLVPERSTPKRQSTLREFGFNFKARRQSTLREFGIIVKKGQKVSYCYNDNDDDIHSNDNDVGVYVRTAKTEMTMSTMLMMSANTSMVIMMRRMLMTIRMMVVSIFCITVCASV